jgi:hypothetical protein
MARTAGIVPWPDMDGLTDTAGWCGSRDDAAPTVLGAVGVDNASNAAASAAASSSANPQEENHSAVTASRAKLVQTQAAASKSGLWGPTHSLDSSESGYNAHYQQAREQREQPQQKYTATSPTTKTESNPNQGGSAGSERSENKAAARKNKSNHRHCDYGSPAQAALSIWNRAGTLFSPTTTATTANSTPTSSKSTPTTTPHKSTLSSKLDMMGEACSSAPCLSSRRKVVPVDDVDDVNATTAPEEEHMCLGIFPMSLDAEMAKVQRRQQGTVNGKSNTNGTDGTRTTQESPNMMDNDSPAARRRARHWHRLVQREQLLTKCDEIEVSADPTKQIRVVSPPTNAIISELRQPLPLSPQELEQYQQTEVAPPAPLHTLEVQHLQAAELERSISELTMRSSYGEQAVASRIPDNRRMAYYAVGKHHRQSGRGGNRRCYFTGKLILGGAPFYAGSVQQGLRTLVVFCLPSALGLPKVQSGGKSPLRRVASRSMSMASHQSSHANETQRSSLLSMRSKKSNSISNSNGNNHNGNNMVRGGSDLHGASSVASKSMAISRMSSLDDLSLSIDGDLDPNWGLDRDYLLQVLPEPDVSLLKSMAKLYPEQFETLPVQVRDATKWKLYVKFCFFSGLPIAQGEMHYKVRDDIAESSYGEEIVLSHDVMEAVNGESAEILSLPNLKAFRYLRKHYAQQCGKLEGGDRVFLRTSWERVLAEV